MHSKPSFTLIELLLVVFLIGVISSLVIYIPTTYSSKRVEIQNLRDFLYPDGVFYLFEDGSNLAVMPDKNISNIDININFPEVFIYKNGDFEKKEYNMLNDKQIVFKYSVKRGIGESFILAANSKFYIFKPFEITQKTTLQQAKDKFLNISYLYKEGEIY